MEYIRAINKKLKLLEPEMETIRKFPLSEFPQKAFIPVLKSSYSKCYDFCLSVSKSRQKDSYIYMPFLRGVCEDIISLKYLSKGLKESADKDTITGLYAWYLQYSSLKAQQIFFQRIETDQIALEIKEPDKVVAGLEKDLKEFWKNQGQNPNKIFPSVQHMAIDSKLTALYDFLYHATSKMVHFSPNLLMRLGWYNDDTDQAEINFDISNFKKYYFTFNNFYAPYLFVHYTELFKKELNVSKSYLESIRDINEILTDLEFYPELITFEEMNKKRPNGFQEHMFRFMKEMERENKTISNN